ncbi:MAG: MJ0802-like protein [Candidatus Alkanophagales archaeon MCA70_species_2]|nr:MJ0802-like protein [Candidatus Alkanophaga liquidiphilum]
MQKGSEMEVHVEVDEEEGALAFKRLVEYVVADLGISRVVEEVRVYMNVEKPLFYIRVRKNPSVEKIEMKDIVEMKERGIDTLEVEIRKEEYAPYLLQMFWEAFGEERVRQIRHNRLELMGVTKEDVLGLPVSDIKEREKDTLVQDMIFRIIPIGFRIVKKLDAERNIVSCIASENPITDEDVKEVEAVIARPPKRLRLTEEDFMKKYEKPKKLFVPYRESYV